VAVEISKKVFDAFVEAALMIKKSPVLKTTPFLGFKTVEDGSLYMYFSDSESTAAVELTKSLIDMDFAVDPKPLQAFKAIKADTILFDADRQAIFWVGSKELTLPFMTDMAYTFENGTFERLFEIDGKTLLDMINAVVFAVSKEELGGLRFVRMEIGKKLRFVSSDGFKLALAEEDITTPQENAFLLNPAIFHGIAKLISKEKDVTIAAGVAHNHIVFSWNFEDYPVIFKARIAHEQFPDYQRAFPEVKYVFKVNKKELKDGFAFLRKTNSSEPVMIEIEGNTMTLMVKSENGIAKYDLEIENETGEDFKIVVNPRDVYAILTHCKGDDLIIKAESNSRALLFECENRQFLSTPIRYYGGVQ